MSLETAQEVDISANIGQRGESPISAPAPSIGMADMAVPSAPVARVCRGSSPGNSLEDGWANGGTNGQRDGRDYHVDRGGSHELLGWEWPSADARRLALGWGLPDGVAQLHEANILIIDDCTLDRENLAATFVANGAPTPIVAWDLPSLVTAVEDAGSPVVVLLSIGTRDSLMLLQAVFRIRSDIRVIVLGVSDDDESAIVACAEAGVAGYHMRTESLDDLLELIRRVAAGESVCSPRVSAILLNRLSSLAAQRKPAATRDVVLTAREAQILSMLEMGLSNRDIAARLCIAVHTVKNHVHSVLTKLGVSTRAEAAARFRNLNISEA
jgi:DNA-binding NarL/FixJ family response regulator